VGGTAAAGGGSPLAGRRAASAGIKGLVDLFEAADPAGGPAAAAVSPTAAAAALRSFQISPSAHHAAAAKLRERVEAGGAPGSPRSSGSSSPAAARAGAAGARGGRAPSVGGVRKVSGGGARRSSGGGSRQPGRRRAIADRGAPHEAGARLHLQSPGGSPRALPSWRPAGIGSAASSPRSPLAAGLPRLASSSGHARQSRASASSGPGARRQPGRQSGQPAPAALVPRFAHLRLVPVPATSAAGAGPVSFQVAELPSSPVSSAAGTPVSTCRREGGDAGGDASSGASSGAGSGPGHARGAAAAVATASLGGKFDSAEPACEVPGTPVGWHSSAGGGGGHVDVAGVLNTLWWGRGAGAAGEAASDDGGVHSNGAGAGAGPAGAASAAAAAAALLSGAAADAAAHVEPGRVAAAIAAAARRVASPGPNSAQGAGGEGAGAAAALLSGSSCGDGGGNGAAPPPIEPGKVAAAVARLSRSTTAASPVPLPGSPSRLTPRPASPGRAGSPGPRPPRPESAPPVVRAAHVGRHCLSGSDESRSSDAEHEGGEAGAGATGAAAEAGERLAPPARQGSGRWASLGLGGLVRSKSGGVAAAAAALVRSASAALGELKAPKAASTAADGPSPAGPHATDGAQDAGADAATDAAPQPGQGKVAAAAALPRLSSEGGDGDEAKGAASAEAGAATAAEQGAPAEQGAGDDEADAHGADGAPPALVPVRLLKPPVPPAMAAPAPQLPPPPQGGGLSGLARAAAALVPFLRRGSDDASVREAAAVAAAAAAAAVAAAPAGIALASPGARACVLKPFAADAAAGAPPADAPSADDKGPAAPTVRVFACSGTQTEVVAVPCSSAGTPVAGGPAASGPAAGSGDASLAAAVGAGAGMDQKARWWQFGGSGGSSGGRDGADEGLPAAGGGPGPDGEAGDGAAGLLEHLAPRRGSEGNGGGAAAHNGTAPPAPRARCRVTGARLACLATLLVLGTAAVLIPVGIVFSARDAAARADVVGNGRVAYAVEAAVAPPEGAAPGWGCGDALGTRQVRARARMGGRWASRRASSAAVLSGDDHACKSAVTLRCPPPPLPFPQAQGELKGVLAQAYSSALGLPPSAINIETVSCAGGGAAGATGAGATGAPEAAGVRRRRQRRLAQFEAVVGANAAAPGGVTAGPAPLLVAASFSVTFPNREFVGGRPLGASAGAECGLPGRARCCWIPGRVAPSHLPPLRARHPPPATAEAVEQATHVIQEESGQFISAPLAAFFSSPRVTVRRAARLSGLDGGAAAASVAAAPPPAAAAPAAEEAAAPPAPAPPPLVPTVAEIPLAPQANRSGDPLAGPAAVVIDPATGRVPAGPPAPAPSGADAAAGGSSNATAGAAAAGPDAAAAAGPDAAAAAGPDAAAAAGPDAAAAAGPAAAAAAGPAAAAAATLVATPAASADAGVAPYTVDQDPLAPAPPAAPEGAEASGAPAAGVAPMLPERPPGLPRAADGEAPAGAANGGAPAAPLELGPDHEIPPAGTQAWIDEVTSDASWRATPRCPAVPQAGTHVTDAHERMWGWAHGESCAYKTAAHVPLKPDGTAWQVAAAA
jgi:hypothetical protein